MKTTTVFVGVGGKIPTQKYGNIEYHLWGGGELEGGDTLASAVEEIAGNLRAALLKQVAPVVRLKLEAAREAVKTLTPEQKAEALAQVGVVEWAVMLAGEPPLQYLQRFGDPVQVSPGTVQDYTEVIHADQGLSRAPRVSPGNGVSPAGEG